MKKCFECKATEDVQEHHVVPASRGGTQTVPLCSSCHGKAHGRDGKGMNHSRLVTEGIKKKFENDPGARKGWGAQRYKEHTAEAMTQGRKKLADEFALENGEFAFLLRENGLSYEAIATTYTAQAKYKTQRGKKTWTKSGIRKVILRYKRLHQEAS